MPHGRIYSAGVPVAGGGGGSTVLYGSGAPAPGLGSVGDSYFDTSGHDVYKKTAVAIWTYETSYLPNQGPFYGYFSGGYRNGFAVAEVITDRLDFRNDSAAMVTKGSLNTGTIGAAGFNSSTYGYVAGGQDAAGLGLATVEKLDFANDAALMTNPGATLTATRKNTVAANSTTLGYIAGGIDGIGSGMNSTDGLVFATDANPCLVKGVLVGARAHQGSANSSLFAYFSGGVQGAIKQAGTSRLDFANDALAMVAKGALGAATTALAGYNSATFGYFSGGTDAGITANTWALSFAADAVAMVAKGALSTARTDSPGAANSSAKGYVAGGNLNGALLFSAICDALDFSNDAAAMLAKGSLTAAREQLAGYQSGGI